MSAAFEAAKLLARQKRELYGVSTEALNLNIIRMIYRAEGVTIDYRKLPPRIRATYMCDDDDPGVLVNKSLPREPRMFSLLHELKHHFADRTLIQAGGLKCGDYNAHKEIEIAAEIFAAEFIWPEAEFLEAVGQFDLTSTPITPEMIVRFRRSITAPISYAFLRKRLEFFHFIPRGAHSHVRFQNLEEQLFGVPIYKQPWFKARRAARRPRSKSN